MVDPRPTDCKLWSLRSCSFIQVVDISVMAHRQSLMVQTVRQTIDFLQLLYKMVDVPVCRSCRFPCRGAEACPMVQTVWTIEIPQLQFLDMVIDAPVVQVCRFPVPSWWRQSSSHSSTVEKIVVSRRAWTRLSTSPLACRHGAAHRRGDELMEGVVRALHTGAGPGAVSTGTRPP